ncbi:MAG: manganese efflux pump [Clostridiales bacterium]|nr:manganese efflux pump [Clostridiales bacterium]
MGILDIILIGIGLSMDAVAVSVSNGIANHKMKWGKILLISGAFGLFQGIMPFLGCLLGSLFARFIEIIAPYLAFVLLGFIGGKMIFEAVKDMRHPELKDSEKEEKQVNLTLVVLLVQAVATSIDAFAVGVNMACYESSGTLALPVWLACVIIAGITFILCMMAVLIGKKTGDVFSDKATLAGGIILVIIAIKMLVEGIISLIC